MGQQIVVAEFVACQLRQVIQVRRQLPETERRSLLDPDVVLPEQRQVNHDNKALNRATASDIIETVPTDASDLPEAHVTEIGWSVERLARHSQGRRLVEYPHGREVWLGLLQIETDQVAHRQRLEFTENAGRGETQSRTVGATDSPRSCTSRQAYDRASHCPVFPLAPCTSALEGILT